MEESTDSVKDVEVCRLCLNLSVASINIFTQDFAKMIEILTSVKIKQNDSLPQMSCLKCARDVKSAFLVRRRIIQSHRALSSKVRSLQASNRGASTSSDSHRTSPGSVDVQAPFNVLQSIIGAATVTEQHAATSENGDSLSSHSGSEIEETEVGIEPLNVVGVKMEETSTGPDKQPISLKPALSQEQSEKIQNLKLALSTKYSNMINSCKQKIHSWKSISRKDPVNIGRWIQTTSTSRNKTTYTTLPTKKRSPLKMYCTICQLKFPNKVKYNNHMSRHRNKICPICDKQIRSAYLKKHMALHDASPAMCEVCGITCKNSVSLRMHFFYYHKAGLSVCEDCGKSFKTKTKLLYHQRKDHTKERNFKCETCGKGFFTKLYLTKHINMKHMKLRPHICEYCGKGFSGKHALRTHIRQHTNETPFHCNFCGESFRQRVSLRGHLKSRHKVQEENRAFCTTCGKGFATDMALEVHMRLHSEIKCPLCSDTFAEKSYLEQHISTIHSNEDYLENNADITHWMNV